MGESARQILLRTTTPSQRFDLGLEISSALIRSMLKEVEVPEDATREERARLYYRALRDAGA